MTVDAVPANRVVHADNLTLLASLPDACLDLVYLDPPFATGARRRSTAGHAFDDPGDLATFVAWLRPRLEGVHRALTPHGSLFVHLDYRAAHYVKVELDRIFGARRFVNELIWCYSIGGRNRRAFGRKHDSILWYARGPDWHFDADAVKVPRRAGSHMRVERDDDGAEVQVKRDRKTGKEYRYPLAAGKVPEDWWTDIEALNRSDRERTGWPTQKPEALLERIIRATSRPDDLVADLFCGSGTTAVVARRLGRRWLAVDASADAVRITRRRLAASTP
ncbi:MAG: site-specific DNA-methyltransferase [Myxococcales bacterium]|nr:site-specific DNA-methyltransferase [Myxococcales bacterium]